MRVVDGLHEAGNKARAEIVAGALAGMDADHRRVAAVRVGVAGGSTEDLGPVVCQPLDMLGVAGLGERVVELRICKASFMQRRRQGDKGGIPARELVDRCSSHHQILAQRGRKYTWCSCRSWWCVISRSQSMDLGLAQARTSTTHWASVDSGCTSGCSPPAHGTGGKALRVGPWASTTISWRRPTPASAPRSWAATCLAPCAASGLTKPGPAGGATIRHTTIRCSSSPTTHAPP